LRSPQWYLLVDALISAAKTWKGLTIRLDIAGYKAGYQGCDCSCCGGSGSDYDGSQQDDEVGLHFLARLSDLPCLKGLKLVGSDEASPGLLSALVGANLTGLQTLKLENVLRHGSDFDTLATAPATLWASLEKLKILRDLDMDFIDDDGADSGNHCVAYLLQAAAPHLKRLRTLRVEGFEISAHGARLLETAAPLLSKVQSILLQWLTFMPNAAAPFLRASCIESLEELCLEYVFLGDNDDAQVLASAVAGLPRLRKFVLTEVFDDSESLSIVQAAVEQLPLLETLVLE